MRFSDKRRGLTLIELLVSMAIISILSIIVFSSLNRDRQRNAAKRAAEQLQTSLQDGQIKAQSGRVISGTTSRPNGYGIALATTNAASATAAKSTQYILFADGISGVAGSQNNQKYDNPSEFQRAVALDTDLIVVRITDGSGTSYQLLWVDFPVPSGSPALVKGNTGSGQDLPITTTATITLKQTRVGLCYSVTIDASTGTVARRQLATCP